MSFRTPILFLIFNRPEITQSVFEEIKKQKPKYLYVTADGARPNVEEDIEKCKATRKLVIDGIDWDCEVKTLFRDENLGCGIAVSEAITWFFENVEQGIILEDDCLPHPSFFAYCETLLERYSDDDEIMSISGNNFQEGIIRGDGSYYFSSHPHIWGWATWKRSWLKYDFEMKNWQEYKENRLLFKCNGNQEQYAYWQCVFQKIYDGEINTWDYQLTFASWFENKLNILPNVNLVKNIGFGNNATHTRDSNNKFSNMNIEAYCNEIIPSKKAINYSADQFTYYNALNPKVKKTYKFELILNKYISLLIPNSVKIFFKKCIK